MKKNKKCIYFQFDVSNTCSVRVMAFSLEEACETFKVIFGESLFSCVKSIYNLNNYGK